MKRGLSGVITAFIVIGVGLLAVGIVWVVISNVITTTSEEVGNKSSELFYKIKSTGKEIKSCKDVLSYGLSQGDGVYEIDTDGAGGGEPIQVYCDMTTDGGGWTFFAYVNDDSRVHKMFSNSYGSTYLSNRSVSPGNNGTLPYGVYSNAVPVNLSDTEMMITIDTEDPETADGSNKIVFFRYDEDNPGFNDAPIPCASFGLPYEYKVSISGEYSSTNSVTCSEYDWYLKAPSGYAITGVKRYDNKGTFWSIPMGGDNTWYHKSWWYFR